MRRVLAANFFDKGIRNVILHMTVTLFLQGSSDIAKGTHERAYISFVHLTEFASFEFPCFNFILIMNEKGNAASATSEIKKDQVENL